MVPTNDESVGFVSVMLSDTFGAFGPNTRQIIHKMHEQTQVHVCSLEATQTHQICISARVENIELNRKVMNNNGA